MATRIVARAIQQALHTPSRSRLLPFLHQQSFSQPNVGRGAPFLDDHSRQPWVPLGFPPHTDAGRSHGSLFFLDKFSPQSALSLHLDAQTQTHIQKADTFLPLTFNPQTQTPYVQKADTHLPIIFNPHSADSMFEALWKLTNSNYLPPCSEIHEGKSMKESYLHKKF